MEMKTVNWPDIKKKVTWTKKGIRRIAKVGGETIGEVVCLGRGIYAAEAKYDGTHLGVDQLPTERDAKAVVVAVYLYAKRYD